MPFRKRRFTTSPQFWQSFVPWRCYRIYSCVFLAVFLFILVHGQVSAAVARASFIPLDDASGSRAQRSSAAMATSPLLLRSETASRVSPSYGGAPPIVLSEGVVLLDQVLQTAAGNEHICMLDVDLTTPGKHLSLVQAYDHLISPDEPLSSMARRTHALAGINGDYFEIGGPGRPIGMVTRDGQLLQSPTNDSYHPVLGVTPSGRLTINPELFSGSVSDGSASYALSSVNIYNDVFKGGLVLLTPALGASISIAGDTLALLQPVSDASDTFTVLSVQSGLNQLPALSGQEALLARGASANWLTSKLHAHDQLHITERVSPDSDLLQAIGGGPVILKNGTLYNDAHPPTPGEVATRNPLTAIGMSRDGTHVRLAVFDGRGAGPWRSVGMTYSEAAHYLQVQGISNAMLFDTGGSSELVARLPGHAAASIFNSPSEGVERPVANGLFIYAS